MSWLCRRLAVEVLADLTYACAIDFDHRLVGIPDPRGIRVALMSPRQLSTRTDITGYPTGVLPVQSTDLVFDDPNAAGNEALSGRLGRGCCRRRCVPVGSG
jgi:hypothetical protein